MDNEHIMVWNKKKHNNKIQPMKNSYNPEALWFEVSKKNVFFFLKLQIMCGSDIRYPFQMV